MNKLAAVDIKTIFLGGSPVSPLTEPTKIGAIVNSLTDSSIAIAGFIVFIFIIGGGYAIISGAGKSNPQSVEKGKNALTNAVIGFALIIGAYWLVQIIDRLLGLGLL